MAPAPFSTACFPYCAPRRSPGKYDEARLAELTAVILDAVNASGAVYLSHTALRGSYALRLAVGNLRTTERHIDQAWAAVASSADRLPIH
jgi:aromatic-L-amino-acid decarboxylase